MRSKNGCKQQQGDSSSNSSLTATRRTAAVGGDPGPCSRRTFADTHLIVPNEEVVLQREQLVGFHGCRRDTKTVGVISGSFFPKFQ